MPSDQNLLVVGARGSNAEVLLGRRFPGLGAQASMPSIRIPAQVSPFTEALIARLWPSRGELVGAIALASASTIPDDTEVAVVALAVETVLALETLASSERIRSLVQNSSDVTIVAPDLRSLMLDSLPQSSIRRIECGVDRGFGARRRHRART